MVKYFIFFATALILLILASYTLRAKERQKLRILCLHGFHGSATSMKNQISGLRETLEADAELVFVDAPSLARGGFGWWHAVDKEGVTDFEDPGVEGSLKTRYEGWELTRSWLVETFKKQGPFDGVLGFSQGGALTGLASALRSPNGIASSEKPLVFDFAIEFSGYPATDPKLLRLYETPGKIDLPSLHIIGRKDRIVSPEKTEELAGKFKNAKVLYHSGDHIIASTSEIKGAVGAFLKAARSKDRAAEQLKTEKKMPSPKTTQALPLWPGRAHPSLTAYFPEGKSGSSSEPAAILVFPGGAYATPNGSGSDAAQWLATKGMVGIRVEYATQSSNEVYPRSFADAARAMRLVRSRAGEWGINPNRIGIMGFSAGGHLASLLATQPDLYRDEKDALLGKVSSRPNFLVLAYPLISFVNGYRPGAYVGSVDNFLGLKAVNDEARRKFSNELHVSASTPPTFIWTTEDDALVPADHSKIFVEALKKAKVPVTSHFYKKGNHGLGLALNAEGDVKKWTDEFLKWVSLL